MQEGESDELVQQLEGCTQLRRGEQTNFHFQRLVKDMHS